MDSSGLEPAENADVLRILWDNYPVLRFCTVGTLERVETRRETEGGD